MEWDVFVFFFIVVRNSIKTFETSKEAEYIKWAFYLMENATHAAISGHIAATLLQRRGVHNNEAAKRNFN